MRFWLQGELHHSRPERCSIQKLTKASTARSDDHWNVVESQGKTWKRDSRITPNEKLVLRSIENSNGKKIFFICSHISTTLFCMMSRLSVKDLSTYMATKASQRRHVLFAINTACLTSASKLGLFVLLSMTYIQPFLTQSLADPVL